jgi:spermidine/putrescine transport system substrate-binding protein
MKRTLAVSLAALLASGGMAQAQGVVNLYNWGNYTPPDLLEAFTEETGIQVNVTDFDSNDTALARVRQGGHGFDIVVPSNTYIQTWVEEGLVQPLDGISSPTATTSPKSGAMSISTRAANTRCPGPGGRPA